MRELFRLGRYDIEVALDFGPRVTGLSRDGGPQVLADLGTDLVLSVDGGEPYVFRGGHRLWASPEIPGITYAPDDHRCQVIASDDRISISAPEDAAGVAKTVELTCEDGWLVVSQRVVPPPGRAVAAWGITQFPLGGTALISTTGADTAPLPDRSLVLWPYTSLDDPRISLSHDIVAVDASGTEPVKLGMGPGPRRIGYHHRDELFIKDVATAVDAPDLGAVAQVYVGQGFCELEALGGISAPGSEATLVERWALVECDRPDQARELIGGAAGR